MNRDDQLSEAATESTYFTAPTLEARTSRQECKFCRLEPGQVCVVGEILVGWLVIGPRTLVALPQEDSQAGACVSRWALLASASRFRRFG